jgi:uncharacterized protein
VEFVVYCRDEPDTADLRSRRGPTLDAGRERAAGSLHLVDLPDRAAARVFAYEEPNYRAGVYRDVTIRRLRNELGRTMWAFPGSSGRFLADQHLDRGPVG